MGSSEKPSYQELFLGKDQMLTKKPESEKLQGKSNENSYRNGRVALSRRLSMNLNVHMGNPGSHSLDPKRTFI